MGDFTTERKKNLLSLSFPLEREDELTGHGDGLAGGELVRGHLGGGGDGEVGGDDGGHFFVWRVVLSVWKGRVQI